MKIFAFSRTISVLVGCSHSGIELIKESYKNALIPKPELNLHYINQLKRLGMYYSIDL